MNTIIRINEATLLAEDGDFRRSFLIELHKYLKDKLPENEVYEYPKIGSSCVGCNELHFETFCISRSMHPTVARELLCLMYGNNFSCDWDYFEYLKVTEEDPEPPRAEYVEIDGR